MLFTPAKAINRRNMRTMVQELEIVSTTNGKIVCKLPDTLTKWTGTNDIMISLAAVDVEKNIMSAKHTVGLKAPLAKFAKFTMQLNSIFMGFDSKGKVAKGGCHSIYVII